MLALSTDAHGGREPEHRRHRRGKASSRSLRTMLAVPAVPANWTRLCGPRGGEGPEPRLARRLPDYPEPNKQGQGMVFVLKVSRIACPGQRSCFKWNVQKCLLCQDNVGLWRFLFLKKIALVF